MRAQVPLDKVQGHYTPWRETVEILLIWLVGTFPMLALAWGIAPYLMAPDDPLPGLIFWGMIIIGMAWLFILSLVVLKTEGVPWTWSALKDRLWLTSPVWRATGRRLRIAFFLVPIFLILGFVGDEVVSTWFQGTGLGRHLSSIVPDFAQIENLAVPQAVGRWDIVGLALVSCVFNYILGEALFFHGVLLPKMERAWGKWAWLGNGVLFTLYHVHKFWMLPGLLLSCLAYSLPAQVFKSNWLAILIHGLEGVILMVVIVAVVMGHMPQ